MTKSSHWTILKWSSLCLASSAVVVPFSMVAPAVTEGDGIKFSESFSILRIDHTLRWRDLVSDSIIAIRVCHVLLSEILHFDSLFWCDTRENCLRTLSIVTHRYMLNGINCTTMQDKIWELSNIGCILVIYFVFASIGSPIRCIPYGGIQSHWLWGEISSHRFCSLNFSDRNIIYIKSAKRIKYKN